MKILFVCTGNTCRSPMAEGFAKKIFPAEYDFFSAGINAFSGDSVNLKAVRVLSDRGIDIRSHSARRLDKQLIALMDLIITMTRSQKDYLRNMFPDSEEKIMTLGDWAGTTKEVSDPWGGAVETYQQCADELETMLRVIRKRTDHN